MTNKYALLNNVEHKNLKVITERSARYGDNVNFAVTFPLEFRNIQSSYPIFFRKDAETGEFSPIALFGFEPRENLFLCDKGWDADYVPLMIRRQPFLIGFQEAPGQGGETKSVVSIDMASPRVSETEGESLFLKHGGTSDFLASMTEMLETIQLANQMNAEFVDILLELELLESLTIEVELDDHSKHQLLGFYTINEEKLQALDGEALGRLQGLNFLESIYMVLASLSCFKTLVKAKNKQPVGA